ncbi:hypothetical protein D1007_54248 [Hordeum vulgare]|nr:hypothetical protein D1007_54248 [Hordeum vulgare]
MWRRWPSASRCPGCCRTKAAPTTVESDARRLHRKNAHALRLAIQLSQRETAKEAATKAKAACHAKEQVCLLCRLSDMPCNSAEDDDDDIDDSDSSISDSDDDTDAPPHADAYMEDGHSCVDHRKGKGSEEMVISFTLPLVVYILIMLK